MKRRTEYPAGTRCDLLKRIYARQFREMTPIRRHIYSLLPFSAADKIFEPGCGSGLLGREIQTVAAGRYTGMDADEMILPEGNGYELGDAVADPPEADIYVSSFFFSSIGDPERWLKKVHHRISPGGCFAVLGEYDYDATVVDPDEGLARSIVAGLQRQGLYTDRGGRLRTMFHRAGFLHWYYGEVTSTSSKPDPEFLSSVLGYVPEEIPEITWKIVWGIWRRNL